MTKQEIINIIDATSEYIFEQPNFLGIQTMNKILQSAGVDIELTEEDLPE